MKALFYGGAFNPPTKAHIYLAEYASRKAHFDKVVFVPSKSKYILSIENEGSSFSELERLTMLRSLALSRPFMEVSDIELLSTEQPRTYLTMKELQKEGYELKLLLGSDWLHEETLSKWMYLKEIASEFGFVILKRSHDDIESLFTKNETLKGLRSHFLVLDTPNDYQDVSSSKVRELLKDFSKNEADIKKMVPAEIFSFLKEKENA